jgi:hypothetical protein
MKLFRTCLACLALFACSAIALAQESERDRVSVPLSDPSRPGSLQVALITGSIKVTGRDVKDVTVEMYGGSTKERPMPEEARGLRRLTSSASISVEEHNNRVEISAPPQRSVRLEIQVPKKTSLELSTVNNGSIEVTGVEGELEISNVNGTVELSDVSGAVVAHTVNGKVFATLSRIAPDKPMAFTSLNGVVDVTLPPTVKANLKLRTDNGSAFTDFELQMLPRSSEPTIEDTRGRNGRYRIDMNKMIYGSVNGGGPEIEMRTFNGNIYLRKAGTSSSDTAASPPKR